MENKNKPEYTHKLVLLGESSVGKSSIVQRYVRNKFSDDESSTIGATFVTSKITLDDCIIRFEIWDTAGQERYHSLAPLYYRNSSVILVVFDVTSYTSYVQSKVWISELKRLGPENAVVILVGNKVDITKDLRRITYQQANDYAKENDVKYIETSAKTKYNIEKLFKDAAISIPKKEKSSMNIIKMNEKPSADKQRSVYCCY